MTHAVMNTWLAEPLTTDVARSLERLRRSDDVQRVAVLPDVHLAREVCIGTAVATRHLVYPAAVGSDIGCGVGALRFDGPAHPLDNGRAARAVLDGIAGLVPFSRRRRDDPVQPTDEAMAGAMSTSSLAAARAQAAIQFGTLGEGNHFLELQADDAGLLWLMVHSGSRGLGPIVQRHHLAETRRVPSGHLALDTRTDSGAAYLADAALAVRWASESRKAMATAVAAVVEVVLGVRAVPDSWRDCDHNHVRREEHLLVHRKGAIHAGSGVCGVIPGSMGTASYHVVGRGEPAALCSASHGAGRRYSRGEARRVLSVSDLHRQMKGVAFAAEHAAGLLDEAPGAYKDITRVMRAQRELVRIERKLRPVLSYKAVGWRRSAPP